MASRLPTPARRLLAKHTPFRSLPSLSQSSLPPATPIIQANLPQPKPATATTTTAAATITRPLSTTPPRPWLLSALPNLAASTNGGPSPPKTLRARRVLPYPAAQIYTLIADIDSYTHFLPHCPHSRVTKWVTTPPTPITMPTTDGSSNAPPQKATGTAAATPPGTRHPALADLTVGWGPFTQTYTSRVYCVPGSVVEAFSNPALGFAVGQLADEKADEMVEAFEGRARELYGGR
ncbi:hypothetical protein CHGG_02642 [Chaetomium globosum CBS 148.51]|uniref:Coenzyme Q-binding protein COQ10 START domain-containing protein n=1 Tax=Chaetomium globosum (strain ATCC 6205 / CBS 148.51 / DSM 1962 / NBRC 6347 / NRRL 1970) TaxID=306901 RepID=Q2HAW2_CHAGB|nr:uncharacterized protein CHGG_02642 [Chaetomium globosum CBS 148.51]EAQ90707.1 hypothetical protein CHGG_02642 [Chaetomium globosum CBS 148.51]